MNFFKKIPKITVLVIILTIIAIAILHVEWRIKVATRQPSLNWSNDVQIGSSKFNTELIPHSLDDNSIALLYPYEDGDKLGVIKLDNSLKVSKSYSLNIEELNFNYLVNNEIFLRGNTLYWRNNKDNVVYKAILDEKIEKVVKVEELFRDTSSLNITNGEQRYYIGVSYVDGTIGVFQEMGNRLTPMTLPVDIDSVVRVKLTQQNGKLYMQWIKGQKSSLQKFVYLTEYKDGQWDMSREMASVIEIRSVIRDVQVVVDNDMVYSFIITRGADTSQYTYLVNGYNMVTKEPIPQFKLDNARNLGVDIFSGEPIFTKNDENGIEMYVTAPTNLDVYSRESNVVKLVLKGQDFINAELISNTQSWSSKSVILSHNGNKYVFWNEAGGFGETIYKGASNSEKVISLNKGAERGDILIALGDEIPVWSYVFLLTIASRFLWVLPCFIWIFIMFYLNHKLQGKYKGVLLAGIVLFTALQIISIDAFYLNTDIMPDILRIKGYKYIIPILFSLLGYFVSELFRKEKDGVSNYGGYFVFLMYTYVSLNYLYAPYMF